MQHSFSQFKHYHKYKHHLRLARVIVKRVYTATFFWSIMYFFHFVTPSLLILQEGVNVVSITGDSWKWNTHPCNY